VPDLTAFKFRLYPNKVQQGQFDRTFGCCRFLWNQMLNERQQAYKQYKATGCRSRYKTEKEYKELFPFLKAVDSKALQNVNWNLQTAYSRFFQNYQNRKAGKTRRYFGLPRFKARKSRQSYTTNCINNNAKVDFTSKKLKLPKVSSWVKYRDPRALSEPIRSITVSKTKSGKYYASILITRENQVAPLTEIHEENIVAFDMSMPSFLVTKEYKSSNPLFFHNALGKIRRSHRVVSRAAKNSNNRAKACRKLANVYEHYVNQKKDWTHKLTKSLADQYDAIILEDLNVEGMKRFNKGYAKAMTKDFSWGEFTVFLGYKMARRGKYLVKVGRFFPSSQLCSVCGRQYHDLSLSMRKWNCPHCHAHHDRDLNASQNLRIEGFRLLAEAGITLAGATGGTPESYACGDRARLLSLGATVGEARISHL